MKKQIGKIKRKLRNRKKLKDSNLNRLRISVSKSLKNISAQIIDDKKSVTLVSANSLELKLPGNRDTAIKVGKLLAEKALKLNVKNIYFDRGSNTYAGIIKSLCDSARENGLEF